MCVCVNLYTVENAASVCRSTFVFLIHSSGCIKMEVFLYAVEIFLLYLISEVEMSSMELI